MISFTEARKLIEKNTAALSKEMVALEESLGFVLAENVCAPIPLPLFDNSAMDGYVLRSIETKGAGPLHLLRFRIAGILKAGDSPQKKIPAHSCYQIMTGAVVPNGGDVVLPQEEVTIQDGFLLLDKPLRKGRHIRFRGEEVKKGEQILARNTCLHPGNVGILAMLGRKQVRVFRQPSVCVIATGSELVSPGKRLDPGKIYDSNSFMLQAAVRDMGIPLASVKTVRDRPADLRRAIRQGLQNDCLLLAGGVSVGDYDYCKAILQELGVRTLFWKVNQKPGKPLFFGKKGKTLVFGLPGNPASVFLCFYEYVYPALRRLSGHLHPYLQREEFSLKETLAADAKKTIFLRAKTSQNGKGKAIGSLSHQGSHMLSSLREANSLILLPPKPGFFKKGERVSGDLLPYEAAP